jgi:hypothetical protein
MMMMQREMDIHEQYQKLSKKKYWLNENQNVMNIVDVYWLLIFELRMMLTGLVLIHWMIMMVEVYAIDDVKLN